MCSWIRMAVCLQNIVWVLIAIVVVIVTVELTRWQTQKGMRRACRAICREIDPCPTCPAQSSAVSLPPPPPPPPEPIQQQAPLPSPVWPINQITHGVIDEFHYVGYISPKKAAKPGKAKRFPLYARRSITQKYAYDYYVVDDSRNKVRINLDLPKNVYELQTGDEVKVDGEVGEWVVTIDIPADTTWQALLGVPPFPLRY